MGPHPGWALALGPPPQPQAPGCRGECRVVQSCREGTEVVCETGSARPEAHSQEGGPRRPSSWSRQGETSDPRGCPRVRPAQASVHPPTPARGGPPPSLVCAADQQGPLPLLDSSQFHPLETSGSAGPAAAATQPEPGWPGGREELTPSLPPQLGRSSLCSPQCSRLPPTP